MSRRLFFCICMLALCSLVQAQTRFGLTVGYNVYQNRGKELGAFSATGAAYGQWRYTRAKITPKLRSGFQAGIALHFRSSKVIQVHTGLLYELISGANTYMYSRDISYYAFYEQYDETNRLGYLTVPLLVSLTGQLGPGKFSVLFGPQFSFATGGSYDAVVQKYTYSTPIIGPGTYTPVVTTEEQGKYKVSDKSDLETSLGKNVRYYRLFHMALQAGLGYEYKNMMLKAYYTMGITNTEPRYSNASYKYGVFYSGFNVSATWLFQLKMNYKYKLVRVKE